MPLKVLDENNSGFYSWWADAMVWAADNGADVINLSAGGTSASSTLFSGVQYAYDAGVIHVSITHNDNAFNIRYPGRYAETITVGATDELDDRASPFCYSPVSGSNYGAQIDVVAPGELILGAAMNGGYNSWCGTSQAAPLVAGLVGIMKTITPSLGREEARHLLRSGAEDQVGRLTEDVAGFDIYHGWGRVNMQRTLQATEASTTMLVDGSAATLLHFGTANALANNYDFIRGDLSALSETAGGVTLGPVVCIEDDSPDSETAGNEDTDVPAVGAGFFYAARFGADPGASSYGGSSSSRDREASTGNCATCGNDLRESAEICDGSDLAGQTCQTQGFDNGLLSCNPGCDGFETSDCTTCRNNICEPVGGEDCLSCPDDCNGEQGGNPGSRYCCGDGDGEGPVGCNDPRCTANGNTCE
jgi:subtilisin family serine protease